MTEEIEWEECSECNEMIPWGYLLHPAHAESCSLHESDNEY